MKEYIEREVARAELIIHDELYAADIVKAIPAADVVEVRHGQWIYEHDDPAMMPCSLCGYQVFRYNNTRYCPNCGAKMDGGADDEAD